MRRKKSKLNFASERQTRAKRLRAFVISFVAFILVFGTVSILVFMKSLDFNLDNLIRQPQDSTEQSTDTTQAPTIAAAPVNATTLFVCYGDEDEILQLSLVSTNAEENSIMVATLDPFTSVTVNSTGNTFQGWFQTTGINGLLQAVETNTQLKIDRYIKQSESNLKKVITKVGDITVDIPQAISYRGTDFSLFLESGQQKLTGDLFIKYLQYAGTEEQTNAVCALLRQTLQAFTEENLDTMFNYVFNLSESNFSVMDYADTNGLVRVYLSMRGKIERATVETIAQRGDA